MLLTNKTHSHKNAVKEVISGATDVYFIVAFVKYSGLSNIIYDLEKVLEGKGVVNVITGLDLYLTDPDALYDLYELKQKYSQMNFYLYESNNSTFHPKIYSSKSPEMYSVLVGSANLTNGGLISNEEASISIKGDEEKFEQVESYYHHLVCDHNCNEASYLKIRSYEYKCKIFRKKMEEAKFSVNEVLNESSDKSMLVELYNEYCGNHDEMLNLEIKKSNYKEAKEVISKLNEQNFKNSDEFLNIYERLVGAAGKAQLWHSGSILRSKTRVAQDYKKFMVLVEFVSEKNNLDKPLLEVFEAVIPFKKSVYGLGFNVITEMLNTLSPNKFPVLNKNPIGSVRFIFGKAFKEPNSFKSTDYEEYTKFMHNLRDEIHAKDFIETDHFLNYVYWKYAKNKT